MPVCLLLGFQHDCWKSEVGEGHVVMGFDEVCICC